MKPIDQFDIIQCLLTPKFEGLATIPVDSNSKPVFQAPWQLQTFVTVILLTEKGVLRLEDFRVRLSFEIDGINCVDLEAYVASNYYQLWLLTLEALLVEKGICLQEELGIQQPEPPLL